MENNQNINQDELDDEEIIIYPRPRQRRHPPRQRIVQQRPRGLAFEIHEKFAKILSKKNEYLAIINQPPIDFNMNYLYRHIQIAFQSHIELLFPGDNEKLNEFNTAFERINNRILQLVLGLA